MPVHEETAVLGNTVLGSTIPGSTVPGSTVPGSTVPGSTVPGSTVLGSTWTLLSRDDTELVLEMHRSLQSKCAKKMCTEVEVVAEGLWSGDQFPAFWKRLEANTLNVLKCKDDILDEQTGSASALLFIIRAYRLAHPNQLEDCPFRSLVHLQLSTAKLTRKDMDCLVLMQTLQHLDFGGCAIDVPTKSITKLFATLQRLPSLRALHMDQIHNHHFKAACFGDRYPDPFPNLHILSIRATSAGATLFLEHLPALSLRKFLWDIVPTVDDSPLCEGRYRPRPQCFDRGVWETLEECAHASLVQLTLKLPEDVHMPQLMVNEERWHASLTALQTLSL
ncbi:hypothetical protein HWV62_32582 [Athelia sp. TMB]|nr:hypothetical protein HWV62_32582 [Athelia sp. TMB]